MNESPNSEGATKSRTAEHPPSKQTNKPIGEITVLVFEAYFLLLSITTTYALWMIWPYSGATSTVRVFGFLIDFKGETDARLLLVAMLAGLLGALVHVTTSFATYLGNQAFYRSWITWFALRPVIGMILGLLFYLIVRAGLFTSTGANAVNPFGVAAISGLAGLFSKQTVDKLKDVFEHTFPVHKGGDEDRRDSLKSDTPVGTDASSTGTEGGGDAS